MSWWVFICFLLKGWFCFWCCGVCGLVNLSILVCVGLFVFVGFWFVVGIVGIVGLVFSCGLLCV